MGAFTSMIRSAFDRLSTKEARVLMLGLDAAGKTTILYKLKVGETVSTIPTIGFNVEKITYKSVEMTAWDVGGQERLRRLWRHYFTGTTALIFVVDSCDKERLSDAKEELAGVLGDPEMRDCKHVLIYANKQDLPGALSPDEVADAMDMESVAKGRDWWVQGCIGTMNNGLYEGLDWMADRITAA